VRRSPRSLLAVAAAAGLLAGCVGTVAPRLPDSVAAALAAQPMRTLETPDVVLYYPEARASEAMRFMGRVEYCAAALRARTLVQNRYSGSKLVLLLPELPFNNAFVAPRIFGYETIGVIPTVNTTDFFGLEAGLPPDPGAIACHELVHYFQFQQIAGFSAFINSVFGNAYTPQIGFDAWFAEGLAVYYESLLQPGIGRLAWPYWQGSFAAGVAGRRLDGGDLSTFNRDYHAGNHYLVGSQFVRFLVERYGEYKLWKLVEIQARSIFFPLGIDLRFWQAYDKTLSTLIDEFADDVQANVPARPRPADQHVLRAAGNTARYARAADGTEAIVTEGLDAPPRLRVLASDGRVLADRLLTDVVPPRTLVQAAPTLTGGMSFTADTRALFLATVDQSVTYQTVRLLRLDIAENELSVVTPDLRGVGGAVSGDGRRYVFGRADGDHHDLAELDLETGAVRILAPQPPGAFVAQPRYSPDGKRVAATIYDGQRFGLALFDAATGRPLGALPTGTMQVTDPSWADDERVIYLGSPSASEGFQVWVHDLRDGKAAAVTRAPYLAFAPQAAGGRTVRFLNREGWGWTLDEVALPPRAPPPAVSPPAEAVATAPPAGATAPASEGGEAPATEVPAAPVASSPPALPPVRYVPPLFPPAMLISDEPYAAFPGILVPKLYGPTFATAGRAATLFGLVVQGNDRLEKHRWALAGYYQPVSSRFSFTFAYVNRQLAPWSVIVSAAQLSFKDVPDRAPGSDPITDADYVLSRRERIASLDVTRAFWGNPIGLGASFIESHRPSDLDFPFVDRRLAGPHLSATYVGAETTPYTGPRRALMLTTDLAAYPDAWSTLRYDLYDLRGQVVVVTPLPLARRHTLTLGGRARDLYGADGSPYLLQLGGSLLGTLWQNNPRADDLPTPFLPSGQPFFETLRGFEDYPIFTNAALIGDATYRYRFIIDRGWASTLWILPALFINQVDLTLFGTVARASGLTHEAAGGALTLRIALGPVPFGVMYQVARRFSDDQGVAHLIALTL
jgi:hypothetical protein